MTKVANWSQTKIARKLLKKRRIKNSLRIRKMMDQQAFLTLSPIQQLFLKKIVSAKAYQEVVFRRKMRLGLKTWKHLERLVLKITT